MTGFTPVSAILGGALIGLALATMLVATGKLAGLSGIIGDVVSSPRESSSSSGWFVLGMLVVAAAFRVVMPSAFDATSRASLAGVALAGVLVGAGTRLGNGCTSGHGVCGVSRLARRSLVATAVFFATGVVTATVIGALP